MKRENLKRLHRRLLEIVKELECEIYADTDNYKPLKVDYEEVLTYFKDQDTAEEGL